MFQRQQRKRGRFKEQSLRNQSLWGGSWESRGGGAGLISCTAFSLALTKQGLIANNRFAEVDTCPTGYFATCSGIAAALIVLCVFVVESLAQAQFVGFAGVYWKANLAMAVVYATMVFIGCMIGLVLYYRRARANQRRIEAELED